LKLFLGHAAYAQSLVLMIYMGGLALGSWLAARFAGAIRRPLLVYALVEAIVGIAALVFHDVFVSVVDVSPLVLAVLTRPDFSGTAQVVQGALLILPQPCCSATLR
jgi:predicted membrane-bound spermidine synthase